MKAIIAVPVNLQLATVVRAWSQKSLTPAGIHSEHFEQTPLDRLESISPSTPSRIKMILWANSSLLLPSAPKNRNPALSINPSRRHNDLGVIVAVSRP
jgi:hypothetical protein